MTVRIIDQRVASLGEYVEPTRIGNCIVPSCPSAKRPKKRFCAYHQKRLERNGHPVRPTCPEKRREIGKLMGSIGLPISEIQYVMKTDRLTALRWKRDGLGVVV